METTIVDEGFAEKLVTTARTAAGDSLRSLTYFTRSNFEQLYLRDDLERDADLDSFIGHEWRGFKNTTDAYRGTELGEYRYTIRVFENGFLLRVTSDRDGVFLTTDGATIRDFNSYVTAIKEVLDEKTGRDE
ncbi:hypothetical protein SAMN05216388_1001389 [Halorientalis persicus]|jgi:hypothetical protein|uniref:Uncharacterized protein n=1 Tax=Halorientalis persicus TaxID=1367881 RepID=A0A1H8DVQ2_9EURY|nr:hypothetical protein [Halorientalis persicus]SEN10934.1 hypothetical protein SAMN05216388_1001389 [Halorientalis persicus]